MEFLETNFINTTTSIVVGSNTISAKNILNRDLTFQYSSDGFNDDLTTTSITYNFDETTTVNRIILAGHNLKSFILFYNGSTANTFSLTTTAATTTSDWATNSETSMYMAVTSVDCTSVTLDMKSTIVANSEKAVGFLMTSLCKLDFEKDPAANGYTPNFMSKEVVHSLSDGGTRIHWIEQKRSAQIKIKNITKSFRDSLKVIHNAKDPFYFVPFGTTTGWDEFHFECVWPGGFDFYKYSDSAVDAGFSGSIDLRET